MSPAVSIPKSKGESGRVTYLLKVARLQACKWTMEEKSTRDNLKLLVSAAKKDPLKGKSKFELGNAVGSVKDIAGQPQTDNAPFNHKGGSSAGA